MGFAKWLRRISNFWIADQSIMHLRRIREYELKLVLPLFSEGGKLLEIGGGAGWQAAALDGKGYEVVSIDLASGCYRHETIWPIIEYDGTNIPFEDQTFDVVFSSNTLEHILDSEAFQRELSRVLRDNGVAIHVLPSATWRFWTIITTTVRYWVLPCRHGEHAANPFQEVLVFRVKWWCHLFVKCGWEVVTVKPVRIFYTGASLLDRRLSPVARRWLSYLLGGACNVFVLRKANSSGTPESGGGKSRDHEIRNNIRHHA
jgi:SAM-dependent methyltransferase